MVKMYKVAAYCDQCNSKILCDTHSSHQRVQFLSQSVSVNHFRVISYRYHTMHRSFVFFFVSSSYLSFIFRWVTSMQCNSFNFFSFLSFLCSSIPFLVRYISIYRETISKYPANSVWCFNFFPLAYFWIEINIEYTSTVHAGKWLSPHVIYYFLSILCSGRLYSAQSLSMHLHSYCNSFSPHNKDLSIISISVVITPSMQKSCQDVYLSSLWSMREHEV